MAVPILFFFAALTTGQDPTLLRSACGGSGDTIVTLPAGTPVDIRFRLADGSDCFKIAANVGGKEVVGYVSSSALAGLERFEKERSQARSADVIRAPLVAATEARRTVRGHDPDLDQAAKLLGSNQPAQALELLEPAARRYGNNAGVLQLAGFAAYRADQLDAALDYWKQSLDLATNDNLARVYERVKREAGSDHAGEKLYGMHIALRYERDALSADTARAILSTLDEEYSRISSQLGCSSSERIVAIVQSRDTYLRGTGAADWSGGWYDGRIHIAWTEEKQVGSQMRRGLAHELVHACLTSIPSGDSPWPAWLQEGLAQKLSGDALSAGARDHLHQLARERELPRLEDLHQDWSGWSIEKARMAYSLSLAATDALWADYDIRNVVNNPQALPNITIELDKKLGL